MKQMTSGMMAGRGFFPPGKGGRRGFPLIGDDFGYFGPHDKPPFPHEFGYPPNFPPPPEGFFPGGPLGRGAQTRPTLTRCHTLPWI